ncbi:hypothetical protein F4776DRAFT_8858 [Hypoxylon sp. NC0597]|nr:hypothetical protein F4776DRAFT_8858 [Hypoxylon sp. NC0597]
MTTIIIRVETMSTREREVVDLTVPSREPSVESELASSITLIEIEADGRERERSKTLSLPRAVTPDLDDHPAEATAELPAPSATLKDKEPCRSPSPAVVSRSRIEIEIVGPSRVTTRTSEASSSITVTELPTTPERAAAAGNIDNGSLSPRERRLGSPGLRDIVRDEPGDYDNRPPSPIDNYPSILRNEDEDDDEDDDELVSSPKSSPDIDLSLIPSPRPSRAPVYHPDFPDRPALCCPNLIPEHLFVDRKLSKSYRNEGREYFMCAECADHSGFGGFICWADSRLAWAEGRNGKYPNQPGWPRCECGEPARENIASDEAWKNPNKLFYKCATNACRFWELDSHDQLSYEEIDMYVRSQVY